MDEKEEKVEMENKTARICLSVSDRAIKLSHCGSGVGRGVVSQSRGWLVTGRDYCQQGGKSEREKHRKGVVDGDAKRGDVSGYQRIVAYDRSLFPSNPSLSNGIPWHSLTISSLSLSFPLTLTASVILPGRTPLLLLHSHLFPRPGASYISLPPSCPLFSVALSPNLHSIPLFSSLHSTPKYCNFSLVATTALQLRNDKFLARLLPCLVSPFLSSVPPHRSVLVLPATTSCFQRG